MKKLLIAAAITGLATGAFAQGTVSFNNNSALQPAIDVGNDATFAPANGFTVALYWLSNTTGTVLPMTPITSTVEFTGVGTLTGGFSFAKDVVVAGQAAGGIGEFEVAGWMGTTFTSYAQAAAANDAVGFGTGFLNSTGGDGTPANPGKQLTGWDGQPDIVLTAPVPEPTTLALGGIGAAALLLFRRRK